MLKVVQVKMDPTETVSTCSLSPPSINGHSTLEKCLLDHTGRDNTQIHETAISQDPIGPCSSIKDEKEVQEEETKEANLTGDDAVVVALMSASLSGLIDTVKTLLQKGVKADATGKDGTTALMLASQEGHTGTVLLLLDHGAQIDTQDTEGTTALQLACLGGHTDTVRLLLEHGARVDIQSHSGVTPLLLACQCGHVDIVNLLLGEDDAQINTVDAEGRFPLLAATNNGHKDVLEVLLEGGANVNIQNSQGYSALMGACLKGEVDCVKLLKGHGADCTVPRSNGTTALDIAREKKHFDIECILVDGRADNQSTKHASKQALHGVSRSISVPRPRLDIASHRTLSCDYPLTTDSKYINSQSATAGALGENKFPFMAQSDAMGRVPINIEAYTKGADVHLFVHVTSQTGNEHTFSEAWKFHSTTENDVKTHQPTSDGSLSIFQLQTILTTLWDVRPKWDHLGLQLQLDPATIEVVKQQNHYQVDRCFMEMLGRWLNREGRSSPTLESLVEALRSPPMGHPHLAEKLKQSLSTS